MIGFGQGFQPVCGFCFGAGRYSRVRQAYTYCIKVGTVVLLVLLLQFRRDYRLLWLELPWLLHWYRP